MAQAPQGPPRKTTTLNDFSGMASDNARSNVKQDEMFFLENIMRTAPHKLHSVPGPLRVGQFPPPVPFCTDTTIRGQQAITFQDYFINQFAPDPGNTRTSWGFIGNGEEVYTLVGNGSCGGGNMNYNNVCCQINHFIGPGTPVSTLPLPVEFPAFTAVNTRPGSADVISWASASSGLPGGGFGLAAFYNIGLTEASFVVDSLFPGHFLNGVSVWALSGNEFWLGVFDRTSNLLRIIAFTKDGTTVLHNYAPFSVGFDASNLQLTTTYCYVLISDLTTVQISRVDRSTGVIASTFDLTNIAPQFISIADDNLIYVLCGGSPAKMYYVQNFTDLIYVGKAQPGFGFTPFAFGTGVWKNGAIYYGSSGFAGESPDIYKVAIPCPPEGTAPIVAGISTGSTVVHGAAINVTWTNILLPDISDRIQLAPAPSPGDLGFSGATGTFQSTSAAASGTISFTIPGPTTPGNYVFQLTTENGTILIATSNVFTVT